MSVYLSFDPLITKWSLEQKKSVKIKGNLSRRELNPGLERDVGLMTSSHTDHYTTEDLQVWTPAVVIVVGKW